MQWLRKIGRGSPLEGLMIIGGLVLIVALVFLARWLNSNPP
jgi:hypothetical protein